MSEAKRTIIVNEFTNGILGPEVAMLGPVQSGGTIIANTAPGCWGPMISPCIRGGHEVTKPVLVEGAEIGDAIAIEIRSVEVNSLVTASGNDESIDGRFVGDPFVAVKCPVCGELYPETRLEGIGQNAVKCAKCGADVAPFRVSNGYTMAFDSQHDIGVTLDAPAAEKAALDAHNYMQIPDNSKQNPIAAFAISDMPGLISRMRPFVGQLGTTPSQNFPDSHNAGDFGQFLVGAPHEYGKTAEDLAARTDGHLDINRVRAGATLICPVKIPGGGVYIGDVHAMQGDGEIAGHTCDVAATVVLRVHVIKGLKLDGPILLPVTEDLPYLARPITPCERKAALALAAKWGMEKLEETAPISFIGSGATLNDAIACALQRGADVLGITVEEVKNRCTVNGALEIGRAPGTATATFLAPVELLKKAGLWEAVQAQYGLF